MGGRSLGRNSKFTDKPRQTQPKKKKEGEKNNEVTKQKKKQRKKIGVYCKKPINRNREIQRKMHKNKPKSETLERIEMERRTEPW